MNIAPNISGNGASTAHQDVAAPNATSTRHDDQRVKCAMRDRPENLSKSQRLSINRRGQDRVVG